MSPGRERDQHDLEWIFPMSVERVIFVACLILLGLDIQTINKLISDGTLAASKPGRRVLIRAAALEALLDATAI